MTDTWQKRFRCLSGLLMIIGGAWLLPHCTSGATENGSSPLARPSGAVDSSQLPAERPSPPPREDAILIAFGDRYKPFAWGEGSEVTGVQVDFVREILVEKMGLNVIFQGCPWKRCQTLVRRGKADGFFTAPTPERAEYTVRSRLPFYETRFVMHVSADNPIASKLKAIRSLDDLESLQQVRHIHMLGSGWHGNALKNMKQIITVPNASVIPKMLVLGRADVYIEQAEMFRYQARSAGIADELLTIEEPVIDTIGFHLFISKRSRHAAIVPEVDRVLESLKANGELERLKSKIFQKYGIQ